MHKYNMHNKAYNARPLQVIVDEFDNPVMVIYANQYQRKIANNAYLRKYNKDLTKSKKFS